ncbi:hypothetical protein GGH91_000496 [Coemansia sp. RSA 2671]|uniref:Uncharacterized protein n=1 Tax=Coemansia spiralis TaxID=417178 RepID=A0A9W8GGX7_9FUNG|nr:hypothetical protein LPJ60_000465 [Coemansia sp. RSA 2675]KAJ2022410.1 hypothetical protein IWW57_004534 [Coemansia sp. S610]KAJ2349961.1 hypothetical protein GGH91_000496 [Coemansia sp. RSA 2671]KAJ2407827.1 hypothetical protein GGI10_004936 [Coemansia sp. RSA 2530]KAJ2683392.1 hypothetical protein IWW39_005525 [Coemansia spiralis]KAJ2700530.1 hypothetical protein H4218_001950 [Coemansia sp. IMI 209128]
MSPHIPNYILERGHYAREYRRRSSCLSRGSSSSAHSYASPAKETMTSNTTSSNDTNFGYGDEELLSSFDLDNYNLGSTPAEPFSRHSLGSPPEFSLRQAADSSGDDYTRLKLPRNASVAAGQQRFGVARPRLVHF